MISRPLGSPRHKKAGHLNQTGRPFAAVQQAKEATALSAFAPLRGSLLGSSLLLGPHPLLRLNSTLPCLSGRSSKVHHVAWVDLERQRQFSDKV